MERFLRDFVRKGFGLCYGGFCLRAILHNSAQNCTGDKDANCECLYEECASKTDF